MAPVHAEEIDWSVVQTEAPVAVDCAPCDMYDMLEAAVAALAGAVLAEILKDLSLLVEAMREGRLVAQLEALQGSYAEAIAPFSRMVADLKTGNMSGFSFIIQFVFALLGLAGRSPSLLAHLPFLVVTAPFRWCSAKWTEYAAARELADQQTRREELVAVYSELHRQDVAAQGTQQQQVVPDSKDTLHKQLGGGAVGGLGRGLGSGNPATKFDVRPGLHSSWSSDI